MGEIRGFPLELAMKKYQEKSFAKRKKEAYSSHENATNSLFETTQNLSRWIQKDIQTKVICKHTLGEAVFSGTK